MDYLLRLETPRDYREVELLTYRAFIGLQKPGREVCDEHLLAHKLRESPAFVPELDYVAELNGKLIGNIMYTRSKVADAAGVEHETLTFGPVSVLPEYQKRGVGAALVRRTLAEAERLNYRAVLIFGHPEYYPRFGFKNAEEYGITTPDGKNFDAFMALELYEKALSGISGRFYYDPVFEIGKEELAAFHKAVMNKLEVFFDYACPYCLRGHEYLIDLLPRYPQVEVAWRPCEAHPRPDRYGPHSDLCIQGMFFALEHGADIWAYHDRMYRAALIDRIHIEDIDILAESVRDLLDADALRISLRNGQYTGMLADSNRYAYERSGVWVVPSYRMNGKRLDSVENIGVTKERLESFIAEALVL